MDWHTDDSFWSTFGSFIYSEERLQRAPQDVAHLLALANTSRPDVLDLCCGTGRHAVEFARLGCRTTGADRNRPALARGRALAEEAGVEVEFVEADMREFARPGSFDLVVNLFTSFGYFGTQDEERRVLAHVHENLRPGGTFIVDVMSKEILAGMFQPTRSAVSPDGTLIVWRTEVDADWTRIKGEWYALGQGTVKCFRVNHWIYSGRELRDLMTDTGFREVALFGDLNGRPYDRSAVRLIAVGRK